MYWRTVFVSLLVASVLFLPDPGIAGESPAKSANQPTYSLRATVIGAAGAPAQGGGFAQKGTLGQPAPVGASAESGNTLSSGLWNVWVESVTGTEGESPIFTDKLFQNYPNPFNPTTSIDYAVSKTGPVLITVYNVKGQRMRQLVNESKLPGRHTVTWDGTSDRGNFVASGVYFYRIQIDGFTDVKKMVILK